MFSSDQFFFCVAKENYLEERVLNRLKVEKIPFEKLQSFT